MRHKHTELLELLKEPHVPRVHGYQAVVWILHDIGPTHEHRDEDQNHTPGAGTLIPGLFSGFKFESTIYSKMFQTISSSAHFKNYHELPMASVVSRFPIVPLIEHGHVPQEALWLARILPKKCW